MVTKKTSVRKNIRSSRPDVLLRKGVLKICSKFTGQHPYRSAISMKLPVAMGVLLSICCVFSEHLFLRTFLGGCFWIILKPTTYHLSDKLNTQFQYYKFRHIYIVGNKAIGQIWNGCYKKTKQPKFFEKRNF